MDWKKIGKALLFPPISVMIALLPVATALLIVSMVAIGTDTVIAYISYVLAAYTLTVFCVKAPCVIAYFKKFKAENKYVRRWQNDARLRVNVSLYGSLAFNALYGAFQLWLGFYHRTFWFAAFGVYYVCLGVMRFFLLLYTRKQKPGERMESELVRYRACGLVFLLMNSALAIIVFFMVYFNRTFTHHMIVAIAMAAYTFTAFTVAIVNVVKYRRYNSPVYSASKAISLTAALVSMLTLEATMLTTFNDGTMSSAAQKWLLGGTGGAVSLLVVSTAIYMIVTGTKKLNALKTEVKNGR